MKIYVNDNLVNVTRLKASSHGFLEVFVSKNSSLFQAVARHLLPRQWVIAKKEDFPGTLVANGHKYRKHYE